MNDAINQSKVTNPELKNLFLQRGIITSHKTDREKLALYYSMFTHGYYDYKRLADILGSKPRREKNTNTFITQEVEQEHVAVAVRELVEEIEHFGGQCIVETKPGAKTTNLKVYYQEFNYRNSEFKQQVNKEANISIESTDDGIVLRHTDNKTVEGWKDTLIEKMQVEVGSELPTADISLSHICEPKAISLFFNKIINGIRGYTLHDVTDVYVHPIDLSQEPTDDDEEVEQDEAVYIGTHISKAALKGQNVLQSEMLKEFYAKGFYISKIIWKATADSSTDYELYELEVLFSQPEERNNFSYLARGYYNQLSDGSFSKSRLPLSSAQERELNIAIEIAAQKAMMEISGNNNE